MSRLFYHVMQDNAGNLLFDVSGTMRLAGTGTLATIYGDAALTVILPNPMTNHPSYGSFKCYLGAGAYDFQMAKAGYSFETLTGLQGWGSMALQNADAVAIIGGSAALTGASSVTGDFFVTGRVSVGPFVGLNARQEIQYNKFEATGLVLKHLVDSDLGGFHAVAFLNGVGTTIGTIATNATATSYNTTSDRRLKEAIEALPGALDVVRALRPVRFKWRSDDSEGHGFVADEVADVVPGVITGDKDALDEGGNMVPQQIDMSKLVPWLTACCQELAQQVQALTARVATLEDGLGV